MRTDTPTTNSSIKVDLRSFINKTPSTAGTTPTSAVTAPTVTAGGTPTTTKSTQAPKVVAKVSVLVHWYCYTNFESVIHHLSEQFMTEFCYTRSKKFFQFIALWWEIGSGYSPILNFNFSM